MLVSNALAYKSLGRTWQQCQHRLRLKIQHPSCSHSFMFSKHACLHSTHDSSCYVYRLSRYSLYTAILCMVRRSYAVCMPISTVEEGGDRFLVTLLQGTYHVLFCRLVNFQS